jgi:hypothetical protein
LECIINVENGFQNVDVNPPILLAKKIGWGANYYELSVPHPVSREPVTFRILYLAIWQHFKPGNRNW